MWNHDWTALILRRLKLESVRSGRFIMKTRVLFLTICTFLAYMYLRSPARSHALFLFLRQYRRSSNGCSATSSRRSFQPSSASDELQQRRDVNQSSHSSGTQGFSNPCWLNRHLRCSAAARPASHRIHTLPSRPLCPHLPSSSTQRALRPRVFCLL